MPHRPRIARPITASGEDTPPRDLDVAGTAGRARPRAHPPLDDMHTPPHVASRDARGAQRDRATRARVPAAAKMRCPPPLDRPSWARSALDPPPRSSPRPSLRTRRADRPRYPRLRRRGRRSPSRLRRSCRRQGVRRAIARAMMFYLVTFTLAAPLFAIMLAIFPFAYLTDRYRRYALPL